MPSILCTKDFALTVSPSDPCGVPTFQINGYGPLLIALDISALCPGADPSALPEWDGILRLSGGEYTNNAACYAIDGKAIEVKVITIGGSVNTQWACTEPWALLGGTCYSCFFGGGTLVPSLVPTDQIAISDIVPGEGANLFNLNAGGNIVGFYKTVKPDTCGGGFNVTGGPGGVSPYLIGANFFEIIPYP